VRRVVAGRAFRLWPAATALAALALYAATINLVPLLTSRGIGTSGAALALAVR
jgi:predicted lysophospholipase L1 biosynthesis ABC-type transport system permease subunit